MAVLVNDTLRISYDDLGPANAKAPLRATSRRVISPA